MENVKWSEIEAECGDFRAGFVATYRRYEGRPTDEKDGQGRTVKVTMASFARHMGVSPATFREWVKRDAGDQRPGKSVEAEARATRSHARKLLLEAPIEEVEKIAMDLPQERREAVTDAIIQSHPARTKPGTPLPPAKRYGFTWEMMRTSGRLRAAIKAYIEAWEAAAPEATEEELEVERDLLAPDLQSLRLTIEGINA